MSACCRTGRSGGGESETYTYDLKNRLIKLTGDGDWDYAYYSYRPDGLRREKNDNLIPYNTLFVWDGGNLVYGSVEFSGGESIDENVYLYGFGLIPGTLLRSPHRRLPHRRPCCDVSTICNEQNENTKQKGAFP